ncbi:hypothetical protein [Armatimonas rosea]|uniref:Uncharacterized protein n=1 Tax=Armatimonas rosea TaxID=685828 RepID=A0A7W9SRB6_ARMRO|nr:hypothetical protein [Armatimonas rosea]MBB6051367.1 hypothetical protein [Armatimonas rosea]
MKTATPWWQYFPKKSALLPSEPGRRDSPDPTLTPGTWVRLRGKPERARRVLRVEWHYYRRQFVYIVETRRYFDAYWFAEQLVVVPQDVLKAEGLQ